MHLRPAALTAALSLTLGSLAAIGTAPPVAAATPVPTMTLTADTTWTAADSPYVLDGTVTVPEGVTLTIEPGATVTRPTNFASRIEVAGTLNAVGTKQAPIALQSAQQDFNSWPLVSPAGSGGAGTVLIRHATSTVWTLIGNPDQNAPAEFGSFTLTDSELTSSKVRVDGTQGAVTITRNLFRSSEIVLNDPQRAVSSVTDNRFRSGSLTCSGSGRLDVRANTFERDIFDYSFERSRLRSQDDCVVDASGNFWEATDAAVRSSRLEGAGRIVTSPLAEAPSAVTPQASPGVHVQDRFADEYGRQFLTVRPSSDGGAPATVVAEAVNRETGVVEEHHEVAAPTNIEGDRQVRIRFDDLVADRLYRLTSYVENDLGKNATLETESFLAPARTDPPQPDATPFGPVTLTTDTTWTKAMSPIELTGVVTVAQGATLTVEPGVEVRTRGAYFDLAGRLNLAGSQDEAVKLIADQCCSGSAVRIVDGSTTARLIISHADLSGREYSGSMLDVAEGEALGIDISDSTFRNATLSVDGRRTTGSLTRNRFIGTYSSEIGVSNPVAEGLVITDNRLRGMRLACSGAGTLIARGNTFERSTSVRSADDCRLDVSGNFWEAPDSTIGNRVDGAGRVTVLPTASSSTLPTPILPPAPISIYRPDNRDLYTLNVTAGSDGGSPGTITAYATDRDSGDVVESHEIDLAAAQDGAATVVFTDLAPGGLYRLSAYGENAAGRTSVVETESFVVPADDSAPNPDGGIFVSGTLTQDTTWTVEDSPVTVTGPLTVPAGRTLTVDPGVVVRSTSDCCTSGVLRVGGTVNMVGNEAAPVSLVTEGFFSSYGYIFSSPVGQPGGTIRLSYVRTTDSIYGGNLWNRNGGSTAAPALIDVSDSRLTGVSLDDNFRPAPSLSITRSALIGLSVRSRTAATVSIRDSRFRSSNLECAGDGRLDASGNTFERGSTYLSSQDDCILDVTESHWEAPDSEVPGRISGAARALVRPTAPAPTADTPRLAPARPQLSYYLDNAGTAVASVTMASDGGATAGLSVSLVDRESGEVVETREVGSTTPGQNLTFEFGDLTAGALYRISATSRNAIGDSAQATTESFLAPIPGPGTPTNVQATAGTDSVTVRWQAPAVGDGRPVTRYTVEGSPGDLARDVAGDTLTATFSNLAPGTYSFTVRASNQYGDSDRSTPVEVTIAAPTTGGGGSTGGGGGGGTTTGPTAAPKAPTNVTATRGDKRAVVSWTPPADDKTVTGYLVYVTPGDRVLSVEGSSSSATVQGLTNGEPYSFAVEAVNAKGASERSAPSSLVVPAGPPSPSSAPSAEVRDGALLVSWTAHEGNGSPIKEYVVEVSPGGTRLVVGGSVGQTLVEGLENGTSYSATVTASNEIGTGEPSAPTTATPGVVPTSPQQVRAKGGDGRVVVTWDASEEDGYPVTGYRVSLSPGSTVLEVAASERRAVLSRVDNGRRYAVSITALSDLGPSPTVELVDVVPAGAPSKVDAPELTVKKRALKVTWEEPDDQGSPIESYVVTIDGLDEEIEVDGSKTRLVLRDLDPGRHRFRVTAINAEGESKPGAWSDKISWPKG